MNATVDVKIAKAIEVAQSNGHTNNEYFSRNRLTGISYNLCSKCNANLLFSYEGFDGEPTIRGGALNTTCCK